MVVVRILSQNVFAPVLGAPERQRRMEELVTVVDDYDVLMLQEVFAWSWAGIEVAGYRDFLREQLLERGFTHFAHTSTPILGQNSGLFVCSKQPITKQDSIAYKGWSGIEIWTWKGALKCTLSITAGDEAIPLTVCDTHLQCGSGFHGPQIKSSQIEQLGAFTSKETDVLVAGDLNVNARRADGPLYKHVMTTLAPCMDLVAENDPEGVTSQPNKRLDYLILRNQRSWRVVPGSAKVVQLGSGPFGLSDHRGVECQLEHTNVQT